MTMLRRFLLIAVSSCMLLPSLAKGDEAGVNETHMGFPGGKCYLYRLLLTDKHGTPYSLSHPEDYLSGKAIQRRNKQGLATDSTDLPHTPAYLRRINAVDGVKIVSKSKWNNTVVVRLVNENSLETLTALPFVKDAIKVFTAPDTIKASARLIVQNDLALRGSPDNHYGVAKENINMVNGRSLHEMGYKGRGITIAIFDGGFMNADRIPALRNVNIKGTHDFVAFATDDIFKESEHGTKVLSTMATNLPGKFVGTAPEADFWLFRTEDTYTESLAEEDYWAAAAEYADSIGVDIISSSLGFQDFDDKSTSHTYAELDGDHALISRTASLLASKGIVHVNSAGNDGIGTWKKINFPADARNILAVGSVNMSRVNSSFSSVGPSQDGRVKPDIMALGSATAVINGRGVVSNDMGTSFAAPIISGLVACLWQSAPTKTALEVMDAIRKSADNYDTPNNIFGYGIPDFLKAYTLLNDNR